MFPPASSKRSKNSRSRGAMTWERRTARTVASRHVESSLLDPLRGQVADLLAHGLGRGAPVVVDPAELHPAVIVLHGVRRAVVAVERHADTPGVDEPDAAGPLAFEGEVRVTEHH